MTRLNLSVKPDWMTENRSAVLSRLTRLQHLGLYGGQASVDPAQAQAIFHLDMPVLEQLELSCFGLSSVRLNCPTLGDLLLNKHGLAKLLWDA